MNIFSIASFIAFVICELLAGFVYFKNPKSKINKSFAIVTFLIGIWTLFPFVTALGRTELEATFFARLVYIAAIFVPPFFLQFIFNLIGISSIEREKNKLIAFYIVSCIFLLFSFSPELIKGTTRFAPYFAVIPGRLYILFFLFFTLMAFLGHYKLVMKYIESTGYKRNQLIYTFISFGIVSLGGLIHFLTAYGIKEIFPHDFLVILYGLIMAYAIIRYRLLDINVVFKKTLAYSLSAGLLMGGFVVFALVMTELISFLSGEKYSFEINKITILTAITIALLFNPLRNKIQEIIDKVFYKKTYDYYGTLRKVSHDLATILDFQKIYSFVGDTIFSTLGLKSIYILSSIIGRDYEVVYHRAFGGKGERSEVIGDGEEKALKINRDSDIIKFLKTSDDILIKDELPAVQEILGQEAIDNITNTIKPLNGEAIIPVFIDNKLEILMILGDKLSGDIFSGEDINLLNTISDQTAIAIKNATLYAEKIHSERLASIGMMAAALAHEIKNPLASIKVFAQLMPERYSDTEFRETFSRVVSDEIQRIDGLVTELLDFSKKTPIVTEKVDIPNLLDDTLELFTGWFKKNNIHVIKRYDGPLSVAGNKKRLKQALINIIINSCQAMDYGGTLRITTTFDTDYANISIEDNGAGIHKNNIEKIFDPFFTTKQMGAGLGLAISKKIIEDHGGKISVSSRVFVGTTFVLSLPSFKDVEWGVMNGTFSSSERQT